MTKTVTETLTSVFLTFGLCGMASAETLSVEVTGFENDSGQIGCALHRSAETFPRERNGVEVVGATPKAGKAVCRFSNLEKGTYAVSVVHDQNKNGKADANLLGMPTEPWGVSKNIRHAMRAPSFDEAAFEFPGTPITISVTVAQ